MTNFKDVAHLYLGCEVLVGDPNGDIDFPELNPRLLCYIIEDTTELVITPILRPLSDMTKKEGNEWSEIKERCWLDDKLPLHGLAEMTKWLLSKKFDLFELIPNGEAIDKTKISNLQNAKNIDCCKHGVFFSHDCIYCREGIEPYECEHGVDIQFGCPKCHFFSKKNK